MTRLTHTLEAHHGLASVTAPLTAAGRLATAHIFEPAVAWASRRWHRYRTTRALMNLSDWQRRDIGLPELSEPSVKDLEVAARRRMEMFGGAEWL